MNQRKYVGTSFFSRGERNPIKLLWTMLTAYFTALGTSSSAALGLLSSVLGFSEVGCALMIALLHSNGQFRHSL